MDCEIGACEETFCKEYYYKLISIQVYEKCYLNNEGLVISIFYFN